MLPGASSIPAADSAHARMASASGRRIVEMVWEDLRPRDILSTEAFENAVTVAMALGGSTNAIIHLIAMAGRAGASLDLDRFDHLSRRTPFLANIRPSGKFLMEDFYYAGGLRGLLHRMDDLLHMDCLGVNGQTLRENVADAVVSNDEVIVPRDRPLGPEGGVAVLRGNLAPNGAVIKHTAADRRLLQHAGPAVVFRDFNDMDARIDEIQQEIEDRAMKLLALRQPMAVDLRETLAAIKTAGELERIGDLAKNIAKRVGAVGQSTTPRNLSHSIEGMAALVLAQVKGAVDFYVGRDAEGLKALRTDDEQIDIQYTAAFRELLTYMMEDPRNITACTHLLFCAKNLERIGDHITNIAENAYYVMTGTQLPQQRPKLDETTVSAPAQ